MTPLIHSRVWRLAAAEDDGSLHALGNGRMLVYGQGPNLTNVWGPPYTSVNLLTLSLVGPQSIESVSSRERTGPIWHHLLRDEGSEAGHMTDVVDCKLPCFVRRIQTRIPLRFALTLPNDPRTSEVASESRYPGKFSLVAIYPPGTVEYGKRFRSVTPQAVHVVLSGMAKIEAGPDANGVWIVAVAPGESEILIAGGPEYPDCLEHAEAAMALGVESILQRTRDHWAARMAQIVLPELEGPLGAAIAQAAEDTALIITTQQSSEGGVVAGHRFCLAYVRDQYGVSRALLALGLHQQARAILDFYWRIFQRKGAIQNAQSIGPFTRFHVHENDDVEITGWFLLQAFDYLKATDDRDFLLEINPMLNWCADAQERHLLEGMLPFNGDETYVAGSFLPRSALDDGSAEATLLYIASVGRLNEWQAAQGLGKAETLARRRKSVDETRQRYRSNFFDGSRLMLNQPRRLGLASRPRLRHGVCQGRLTSDCCFMDWVELTKDGRYGCPACFPQMTHNPPERNRYFLPSVAVTPAFIQFPVAERSEQVAMIDATMKTFSAEDGSIRYPETLLPGYELGMVLFALAELQDPRCAAVAKSLLALRDPTGSWVEYYTGALPMHTRCRPWESSINLCGLLNAARRQALVRQE
jgi:hypothetical protein